MTHYQLAERAIFTKNTGPLVVINKGGYQGIELYARDEKAAEYVRVLETAAEQFVDDEAQAYSVGNFETMESARHFGSMAYRHINKGVGA
jgi:hypothetical protein